MSFRNKMEGLMTVEISTRNEQQRRAVITLLDSAERLRLNHDRAVPLGVERLDEDVLIVACRPEHNQFLFDWAVSHHIDIREI